MGGGEMTEIIHLYAECVFVCFVGCHASKDSANLQEI